MERMIEEGIQQPQPPVGQHPFYAPPNLEMDFLMELPEDIRNEILNEQRILVDPVRPENENQMFLESLEPALREEILLEATPDFLATLSADLRAEAEMIRERRARRMQVRIEQTENNQARNRGPSHRVRIKVPVDSGRLFPAASPELIQKAFASLSLPPPFNQLLLVTLLENKRVAAAVIRECLQRVRSSPGSLASEQILESLYTWTKSSLFDDQPTWAAEGAEGLTLYDELVGLLPEPGKGLSVKILVSLPSRKVHPRCLKGLLAPFLSMNHAIVPKLEEIVELNPDFKAMLEQELGSRLRGDLGMEQKAKLLSFFLRVGISIKCQEMFEVHRWAVDNNYEDEFFNVHIWKIYESSESKEVEPRRKMTVEEEEEPDCAEDRFRYAVTRGMKIVSQTLKKMVDEKDRIMDKPIGLVLHRMADKIPFETKMRVFRHELSLLRQHSMQPRVHLILNREKVFAESYNQIMARNAEELRAGLVVKFANEDGYDAGGVSREWFMLISREIFNPNYGLFEQSSTGNTYQPSPLSYINIEHLPYFKFIGRVVGKALYEGCYVDAFFSSSFYKQILGRSLTLQDIEQQDYQFFKSMKWILENPIGSAGLTFTYDTEVLGKKICKELVPKGSEMAVTEENKASFVEKICEAKMQKEVEKQLEAFMLGFSEIIPRRLVTIFSPKELELMISGLPEVDLEDLKNNTEYEGYSRGHVVVGWFWEILATFDQPMKALFLQFVTGTSRVPPEGFQGLKGIDGPTRFSIHKDFNSAHLPKAHTCLNQLDLPEYPSREILHERLMVALTWGNEGFGFA